MSVHTFKSALAERREQLGLTSLRDTANFLNDHRTSDEPGHTTRYSVRDWMTRGRMPGAAVRPVLARALCIPLETIHLMAAGVPCEIPPMPDEDELLGGSHAE